MLEKNNQKSAEEFKPPFFSLGIGEDKKYFIENLAMLLESGVNINSALEIIRADTRSKQFQKIIQYVEDQINLGTPVWQSLKKTRILANRYLTLIRIGEETGRIVENLNIVAAQEQKEREFRSKIRSAMLYPAIVFTLALILGLGISWFILPRLASVFSQLKLSLPLPTRILIETGKFLSLKGAIAVPASIALFLGIFYFIFIFKKTKFIGQFIMLKFPGIGALVKEVEMARFGYLLGTLLEAGIPIIEALTSVAESTNLRTYKKFYDHLKKGAEEGHSFAQSFAQYPGSSNLISLPIQHLITTAEQSGRLPDTFKKIGNKFESKVDITTKNLATILEPIMLILVWLGVVFIALAIILPIYKIIGGLNH